MWPLSRIDSLEKLGVLLKQRRTDLEGTPQEVNQIDIAVTLGLSQAYISRLEGGSIESTVRKWRGERIYELLKAYRLSPDEMQKVAERFDLALQLPAAPTPLEVDPVTFTEKVRTFPVYSAQSLGRGSLTRVENTIVGISSEVLKQYGVEPDAVMVVRIGEDCLISHKLRFSQRNLAFGDNAALNIQVPPRGGDVVACWDKREGVMIFRYSGEGANEDMLPLYDSAGVAHPVALVEENLSFRGVVFYRDGGF